MTVPLAPDPANPPSATTWPVWQLGRFRFHSGTRQLSDGPEHHQSLTLKSAEVLKRLIAGGGEVVSREQLINEVWQGNSYTGSQALTHTIWQLRRALDTGGDSDTSAIATVSKSGYRLTLPVSLDQPAPAAPPPGAPAPPATPTTPTTPAHADAPLPGEAAAARPRRRTTAWLAALLLAMLAALTAGLALRATPPAPVTSPPQPLTLQDGVEDFPALSADGRQLAYTWQGADGPARIRITPMGGAAGSAAAAREITDPEGRTLARPVWLGPDRLAYVRAGDASDCRVVVIELASGARRDVAGCYYARGQPVLDASPDGQWLAMARHGQGSASIGIVLHRLADGQERVLTRPAAGFDDAELAWSHDGRRIAFLRSNATVGDVYRVEVASGATTRLTRDEAPVAGLAWAAGDGAVVFNSARGGSFATWRVAPDGGEPALFTRLDTPLNLAAVPGQPLAILASVHRFSDHIELYRLDDGRRLSAITSSGRDLYGQACPSSRQVLFNSLRSGRVELWRSDGREARRVDLPPGIPEPAACLSGSTRFATSLRPPGAAFDQLVFGDSEGSAAPQLYGEAAHFTNVAWALDGRSVIVASDRDDTGRASAPDGPQGGDEAGDWDLWRFDLASRRLQRLTDDHGSFGREVETPQGRWLYYARLGQPGLWRRTLAPDGSTGPPQPVTDRLATDDWGNWLWHAGALWLIERAAGEDRLLRLAPDGSSRSVLSLPRGTVRPYSSLSIGDDGVVLLTVSGPRQADIVRIGPP